MSERKENSHVRFRVLRFFTTLLGFALCFESPAAAHAQTRKNEDLQSWGSQKVLTRVKELTHACESKQQNN